jgi:hypothetical protein
MGRTIIRVMEDNFMTSYSVGLRHKTRAKAITIERPDASLDRGPFCLRGFALDRVWRKLRAQKFLQATNDQGVAPQRKGTSNVSFMS